tara:strand:- start:2087 stop:2287 length:201 start_codon:yes stop_codon:yes gene_type:complete
MTAVVPEPAERPVKYVVRYGDQTFEYRLTYRDDSKKAAIKVHVHPNGQVEVEALESASLSNIKAAV